MVHGPKSFILIQSKLIVSNQTSVLKGDCMALILYIFSVNPLSFLPGTIVTWNHRETITIVSTWKMQKFYISPAFCR